jgi:hypothetical protein
MHHFRCRGNRNTFGESLIVITAIAGFFYGMGQGLVSMDNLLNYVWFLLLIAGFYFLILFARMMFFWMTGGDHGYGEAHLAGGDPSWAHHGKPLAAPKKK